MAGFVLLSDNSQNFKTNLCFDSYSDTLDENKTLIKLSDKI